MYRGNKYFFSLVFFSFALGIYLAYHFSFQVAHLMLSPLIIILLILVKYLTEDKLLIHSIFISIIFIFFGIGNYLVHSNRYDQNQDFETLFDRKIMIRGIVNEINYIKKNKIKFIVCYDKVKVDNVFIPIEGSCLVEITPYQSSELSLGFFKSAVKIGNTIQIEGYHSKPSGRLYPGDFDYLEYLEWKNVSGILRSNEFSRLDLLEHYKYTFSLRNLVSDLRQKLFYQIDKNFEFNSAFLLRGLLVGDQSEIPSDVKTNFVNSGVAHVMAVSGQQIGYILIILIVLFGRFNKYLQLILVSLSLLFFVLTEVTHIDINIDEIRSYISRNEKTNLSNCLIRLCEYFMF